MKINVKKTFISIVSMVFSGLFLASAGAYAQFNFDAVEIETIQIDAGVYVLMGGPAQGNILVSVGNDGIFLVDTMYAVMHDKIIAALAEISDQPVRYVVNTHLHGDHTQGNAAMAELGALVISHQNMRSRMFASANYSDAVLPAATYSEAMTLHFNGEEIYIYHPLPAHTDGDSIIYFRNANIMHVGDVPSSVRYPNIGLEAGGSVAGMTAAAEQIMQIANEDTKIIAGHLGPVVGYEEIRIQLEMFSVLSERIQTLIDQGMTLEEVLAAKPSADFDEARAAGAITAETFVTLVYTDLSNQ